MSNRFRAAALALRNHISDTYALLDAADSVVSLIETEVAQAESRLPDPIPHWLLVRMARDNYDVMEALRSGKRINAIKALRAIGIPPTGSSPSLIGLKAAKEAIEDPAFESDYNLYNKDPWEDGPQF